MNMNISFSIYTQFKSKVDKLIRVVCEWCEMLGHAYGNETGLARYGFEKSRLAKAKTKDKPNKDQRSRPNPKAKQRSRPNSK